MEIDLDGLSTGTLFDERSTPDQQAYKNSRRVGRYRLLHRLGVGGMGEVWAAWDPQLERELAIKFLHRHIKRSHDHTRLLREAQAMARVSHPNIVVVHDVGMVDEDDEGGGALFVAMEFVRGKTLRQWRAESERRWSEIVNVYVQAARGLAAAHEAGLVHRDFKPDNAMVERVPASEGEPAFDLVRVMDFGLAATIDVGGSDLHTLPRDRDGEQGLAQGSGEAFRTPLTQASALIGTPAYMSLEQLAGERGGPATDQFSFCVSRPKSRYRLTLPRTRLALALR